MSSTFIIIPSYLLITTFHSGFFYIPLRLVSWYLFHFLSFHFQDPVWNNVLNINYVLNLIIYLLSSFLINTVFIWYHRKLRNPYFHHTTTLDSVFWLQNNTNYTPLIPRHLDLCQVSRTSCFQHLFPTSHNSPKIIIFFHLFGKHGRSRRIVDNIHYMA